jgi:hypothetical protein
MGRLFALSKTGLAVLDEKWVRLPGISELLPEEREATFVVPSENCVAVAFCNFNQAHAPEPGVLDREGEERRKSGIKFSQKFGGAQLSITVFKTRERVQRHVINFFH